MQELPGASSLLCFALHAVLRANKADNLTAIRVQIA
jgi:hypothetical protein